MKRFITYLYEYRNGERIKNTGHLRVDIRNQRVVIQVSVKDAELEEQTGTFFIIVRAQDVYGIPIEEIQMKSGQYNGDIFCMYHGIKESEYSLQQAIGIGIRYENGCYIASSWKDEEDEVVARGDFQIYGMHTKSVKETTSETERENYVMETAKDAVTEISPVDEKQMEAASISTVVSTLEIAEHENEEIEEVQEIQEDIYTKLNLNEICTLPSSYWHYSNNSFLIHGFWNYGYLVLKENVEKGHKKYCLGVPGIFEQPEMVMAAYFGFPSFETVPSQVAAMEIGQKFGTSDHTTQQQPKTGVFGCWFTNL